MILLFSHSHRRISSHHEVHRAQHLFTLSPSADETRCHTLLAMEELLAMNGCH